MNTIPITDDNQEYNENNKPGAQLAAIRNQQGYSTEYIAEKLHLRVKIIELLEADTYHSMPEPVFIKGYLRAYAKLLNVQADPLLEMFNNSYKIEQKSEKALWQSRREPNKAEHAIRWVTGIFAIIVLSAVTMWWYTNKDNEQLLPSSITRVDTSVNKSESEIRLTDLSKMRSLLSSHNQMDVGENEGE
jgi:cytoskeleton protein RodZ